MRLDLSVFHVCTTAAFKVTLAENARLKRVTRRELHHRGGHSSSRDFISLPPEAQSAFTWAAMLHNATAHVVHSLDRLGNTSMTLAR
jgi:hypothetical protein